MPTAEELLACKDRRDVFTTAPDATVQEACALMRTHRVGCLVVVKAEKIVGIFTERDVINRVVAEGRDAAATKVRDVMTHDVIVVRPDRRIEEIEGIMRQNRIRHLPVAGEQALVGILSIGDVAAWHSDKNQQMVEHLTDYLYGRH